MCNGPQPGVPPEALPPGSLDSLERVALDALDARDALDALDAFDALGTALAGSACSTRRTTLGSVSTSTARISPSAPRPKLASCFRHWRKNASPTVTPHCPTNTNTTSLM
eukprot:m.188314 g.188314  ORF g.188314 m.188314 type:complete len:110 (-) comp18183_c0_seq2:88-417(-)